MISRNNKSVVLKQSDQEQDDDQGVLVSIMGTGATEARPTSVIIFASLGTNTDTWPLLHSSSPHPPFHS